MVNALEGVNYRQDQIYVRGHVEHVVKGATVYLRVLVVTMKNVHVMQIWLLMVEDTNVL